VNALGGKTALITGATGAIATASAIALARDGAHVVLMGRRAEGLAACVAAIRTSVPDAKLDTVTGDGLDESAVKAALAHAHGLEGHLDIIVSTVGGGGFKPLLMLEAQEMRAEFEANTMSAFLAIRHGAPLMERGGSIICISSTAATMPFGYLAAYHVGKAALEALVRAAAEELGSAGIRVNAVRPGMTRARDTAAMFDSPDVIATFMPEYPLGRLGEPADIAGAVRFLAGQDSGWMTGQSFAVDGGNELRRNPDLTPMVQAMLGAETVKALKAGKEPK
jgi:NAD(P)-dependent dehydrogenase (short-subunit alcohol dehydrogenase family)